MHVHCQDNNYVTLLHVYVVSVRVGMYVCVCVLVCMCVNLLVYLN